MRELALFAGAGGGILGGHLMGWRCVCAVEIEDYPRQILLARQRDGILPRFPIWDDITTFDGRPWCGRVDVVSGGFPCQDISCAGKGAGIGGQRSGLWAEMARIICEVQPRYVFVENSPMLTVRGLGRVLGDLAALGYDARWGVLGARGLGAPFEGKRIWIKAWKATSIGLPQVYAVAQKTSIEYNVWMSCTFHSLLDSCPVWTDTERGSVIMGNRLADWMGGSKAIGNGQVPGLVRLAWEILYPA